MIDDEEAEIRLTKAFLATEEMDAWQGLYEAVSATEDAAQERAEVPLAFLKLVIPEIAAMPTMFQSVKEVWNRVCDAEGLPHRKFTLPEADEGENLF